jgi:hypothetical protein
MLVASWVVIGQQPPTPLRPGVELSPLGVSGQAVWPAFEGWGPLKDGTTVLLIGYFNRNKEQELDIPIGPDNNIEPGGPDYGQPTHFYTGRQWGVFAIPLPKDFGARKLTWTLVANGQKAVVSFWTNPPYWIDFFRHSANGNTPPVVKFSPDGPELTGPPKNVVQTLPGVVGQPVTLKMWASDKPATYEPESPGGAGRGRGADAAGRGADSAARGGAAAGRGSNFDVSAAVGRSSVATSSPSAGRGRGGPPSDVTIIWKKYRGPGEVRIADEEIRLLNKGDVNAVMEATTSATFSEPGEYWLRAQVNDASGNGGGGDQCCWTTAHVRVIVKPAGPTAGQ